MPNPNEQEVVDQTPTKPVEGIDNKQVSPNSPPPEVVSYVSNGMKLLHSKETRDNIVQQLKSVKNPAEAVSLTMMNVVKQLDGSAQQSGNIPTANTVLMSSAPLMEQVIEIGEASGALKITEDEIKEAAGRAVTLYIQDGMQSGKITMANLQDLYGSYKNQAKVEEAGKPVMEAPTQGGA